MFSCLLSLVYKVLKCSPASKEYPKNAKLYKKPTQIDIPAQQLHSLETELCFFSVRAELQCKGLRSYVKFLTIYAAITQCTKHMEHRGASNCYTVTERWNWIDWYLINPQEETHRIEIRAIREKENDLCITIMQRKPLCNSTQPSM